MSVNPQRIAFAFGVPSGFYEFYLYSRNSILLLVTLVQSQKLHIPRLKPGLCYNILRYGTTYLPFTPSYDE